jgi:chromosome condensin MukBEF MukE localization factor
MKNTKRFFNAGVVLAIVLFASVQVAQISANSKMTELNKLYDKRDALTNKLQKLGFVYDALHDTWKFREVSELKRVEAKIRTQSKMSELNKLYDKRDELVNKLQKLGFVYDALYDTWKLREVSEFKRTEAKIRVLRRSMK